MQVKEVRKRECRFVTKRIQVCIWRESELTSNWSPVAKEFEELYYLVSSLKCDTFFFTSWREQTS
ncbi:hypothetical protein CWO17_25005 [Vibrio sp. 10N.286.45.A3]|nr:hypothetical protein CWO17_25005 [Vibrio sp. 10N.286.45.A3]